MTTEIAKVEHVNGATVWTPDQVALIKRTVAPDATDDELKVFLHQAQRAGLDPLQKQIHFTKRSGRVTTIAGIDGLRARAGREPDFEGLLHAVVCQKDEFLFDATTGQVVKHTFNAFGDRGPVVGAWASVHRRGRLPFTAIVRFSEFCQPASPTWKQMPHVMIDKVAQSTALRAAYPDQFSAIYEPAEMDQAEKHPPQDKLASKAEAIVAQVEAARAIPATITLVPVSVPGSDEKRLAEVKPTTPQPPRDAEWVDDGKNTAGAVRPQAEVAAEKLTAIEAMPTEEVMAACSDLVKAVRGHGMKKATVKTWTLRVIGKEIGDAREFGRLSLEDLKKLLADIHAVQDPTSEIPF